jgi:GNAT superfamily N-acetyltransferase
MNYSIRPAKPKDIPDLLRLVKELADFGGDLKKVAATESDYTDLFFAENPVAESLVAEVDNQIVAHAVFFRTSSTYAGKPGLYLEDLYVQKSFRGQGIGKSLFHAVVKIAQERNYCRVEWKTYSWNKDAIAFYELHGATPQTTHTEYKLSRSAMDALLDKAKS